MAVNVQNTSLRISAGLAKQFPSDPMVQIAFSGRSNVGKSSLINSLLGRKSLARVSSAPGKTITVNFYDVDKKLFLVDLPGYGFAKRRPEDKAQWSALTDGYFTNNKNLDRLRLVVQLIDSRVGPTADDEMMLSFLSEAELPFLVVATKCDKLNATERKKSEEMLRSHPLIPTDVPILFSSSLKGDGKAELWKQILAYAEL
jgi:GTP-binding protein